MEKHWDGRAGRSRNTTDVQRLEDITPIREWGPKNHSQIGGGGIWNGYKRKAIQSENQIEQKGKRAENRARAEMFSFCKGFN